MFCSTIIPSVGRITLARAVKSVLSQSLAEADFEIIIVNDSGKQLSVENWQSSEKIIIIQTNHRERSVARNTGASIAKGQYLHFLDDDDWIMPDAYQHFWELSQKSSEKWLYGETQLVDRQNNPSIQLRHSLQGNCFLQTMAGEWIPLQSSLIERKTFMRIGGFNPLLSGPEDIDLLRRFLLEADIAETSHQIAQVIMGGEGSTTDYNHHPQASRMARENILDDPRVFTRMQSSAVKPFWQGKMSRVYLTSAVWNLIHLRFFTAASRFILLLACLISFGVNLLDTDFWRSILSPYASLTFEKGIREAQQANQDVS